ncbi:hypothetical protein HAX54_027268 [Datura stramonium]|uniref:Uncharacterized protein n=1 Tax=Datura stramonium TaxID=4076 RepID=A0ABS8V4X4_DATST|nr:hypothetical protein [Datura stramonium]
MECIDNCCWLIGYLCITWWLLLFLCNFLPANLLGLKVPESPGTRLKNEGLNAHHPVVLVPGIVTGGLELWEGRPCSEGLFRKRLWGGSFGEIFKGVCVVDSVNFTGLDPPGIRVRAVTGLVAADYFAPGYFVWAILIENLAKIGYSHGSWYHRLGDLWFSNPSTCYEVIRTWDAVISLLPKGGERSGRSRDKSQKKEMCVIQQRGGTCIHSSKKNNVNHTDTWRSIQVKELAKYGRLVSFGKVASEIPCTGSLVIKEIVYESAPISSSSREELLTEYDGMSRERIKRLTENKAYTARTLIDLLRFVAPKTMQRAEAHFSHGLAENLEDPNLPDAPDMEIFCSYGVGIPTERSYVYKMSPSDRCKSIPLQIDISDGEARHVSTPRTFATYVREYQHKPPASFLEGRGTESGAHVDILGNFALIEDVLRVAAGASGTDLGGDRIYSGIMEMSERINIQL